jgi:hypothetical protein
MSHIERRIYRDQQYQEIGALESWSILLDIHNALVYGFIECRLPEPGRPISVSEAEKHISSIELEWQAEARKRDLDNEWSGSPPISRMPLEAKLYLHSILQDAWRSYRGG